MMRGPARILVTALMVSMVAGAAEAAEHRVTMREGPEFDPPVLKVVPGDTVHFVAEGKGHNAESVAGMIPAGAAPFAGPVGQDFTISFTVPGVYGYQCHPHASLGMVGLIVVGQPVNEQAAKAAEPPGKARQAFAKLFRQLDGQG